MTRENSAPTRRASLELLRAEAADELSVLVEERLRAGEDPWEFMDDLPTVDELVVLMLRAENILTTGLPSTGIRHYRVLRQIALDLVVSKCTVGLLVAETRLETFGSSRGRPP